jgi:hypothetical protein
MDYRTRYIFATAVGLKLFIAKSFVNSAGRRAGGKQKQIEDGETMSQTITRSKVAISTGIPDSMNEARQTIEIRPKAKQNAVLLGIGCAVFSIGGLFMVFSGEQVFAGLLALAFFGGGVCLYAIPKLLRRKASIAHTSEGIELRYVTKAIFLFLLLAGCASEDANISREPPAVPATDEGLSIGGEDATVIADDEVTQPASAQGDDSNVGTQSRNAYTASANDQNYDTQRQYQQQQDDDTRRFYHNQDVQRQYHNQDVQRYNQQSRQNTFDTRRGVQPLPLPRH